IDREPLPATGPVLPAVDGSQDKRAAKAKLRAALRDRDEAESAARLATSEVRQKDRLLATATQELTAAEPNRELLAADLERAQRRLTEMERVRGEAEKATSTSIALRKDLKLQQGVCAEMEADRAELAVRLATARRDIVRLKLELALTPRGAEAAHNFIQE